MNAEIVSFLHSAEPCFEQGFALFCKYSRNRIAMDWISRRRDMPKLLYELGKLAGSVPAVNPSSSVDSVQFSAPVRSEPGPEKPSEPAKVADVAGESRLLRIRTYDERRTWRADLPPELQEVFDRNAEDYKIRRGYHEKMKMAATDADRALFRGKIMQVQESINAGWERIDGYFDSEASTVAAESFNEGNFRTYLCKALKRKANTPKQVATCKARAKALLDHGCILSEVTIAALEEKGLI